ncbi:phosphate acyltransferase [endosymbiont of Ridgeia piscesae]|uniref:Malic enzyme, N-terminal domain n=1 Tax=endosymbiont of Ridgeia piscesae TaxID=54398 RepID=A0A0T5Z150_9GAMM|nr:phosphate acyltransferase [endosymbiont of Ridgeia piscesae]KRT56555.1 NADP-dependent malic enzyme [endosymbiont of Ridgeia piscesae]KRT57630.1 Malic enzyme, N-terminal domain [endosymbiont of Ridgeia piscesae]
MSEDSLNSALRYHRYPRPGKLEIKATKPLANQLDLSLAYSPGVAEPCREIAADPAKAADYTARGNLVAVVTNGTAVLGLGAIGGLASKPVMEGKAVLFKKFADIDVFDIEVDETDPVRFIEIVAGLEPTFGGINLEDIKAPDCFIIEEGLKQRMKIPVFHDDQHGTAIVVSAAILNALQLVGKEIGQVRLVASGAGAAALACLDLLVGLGMNKANIVVTEAEAAMESGVAQRPIADLQAYREGLQQQVFRTGMTMKPVFDAARSQPRRVVYAEGEEPKVLQLIPQVVEQGIARPILIGRRAVVERRICELGLVLEIGQDLQLVDPQDHPRYPDYCKRLFQLMARKGCSPTEARQLLRTNSSVLAAMLLLEGDADALICGLVGRYRHHLEKIQDIIGPADGVKKLTSMSVLVLDSATLFITDSYVQEEPEAEDIAEIVRLCADEVRWFGVEPKAALLSHSNFGSHDSRSSRKMQQALKIVRTNLPELEIDGEMHADLALDATLRTLRFPDSGLAGAANLLVMPNQDAANIAFNMLKVLGDGITIGPVLVGAAGSAHIVTPSITVRGLLNMTALASVRAR